MTIRIPDVSNFFNVNMGDLIVTDSGYYMFVEGDISGQFKYDLINLENYKTVNRYPQLYAMKKLNVQGEFENIINVIPNEQLILTVVNKEELS